MVKTDLSKKMIFFFTSKLDLNLKKKLMKCYIWSIALYGAETWKLRKADQKYLERFEMWCWRRMEISWTDRVRNEERVKEDRNILPTIQRGKANWIGHVLRRNCLLKHITEGKIESGIEMMARQGRRCKQLQSGRNKTRGYWKVKEEALDRTVYTTCVGRGDRLVVRLRNE
jgi:hypothetical protein